MITALFICSGEGGDVIFEKHYRGAGSAAVAARGCLEAFWEAVAAAGKPEDVPPILVTAKHYIVNIYRDGLYLLATLTSELPALSVVEFLHRVYDVFLAYFSEVTARSLTGNFSTAYQLLDEMLDNGHPVITEPNALMSLIAPPSLLGKMSHLITGKVSNVATTIGEEVMSVIPWRRSGVKHVQNQITFDIVEEVDAIYESNSTMVSCDVRGYIRCNCQLSGTPDVTIVFNTPAVIEDCSFHPCVRYARWERESVVSFIPPDGVFTLMSYRVVDKSPSLPLAARPLVTWREGGGRASFTITQRPGFIRPTTMTGGAAGPTPDAGLDDVRLVVSLPKGVKSQDLSSDVGHVTVAPRTGDVTWSMRSLPRDRSPELAGNVYTAPGTPALLESLSATLHFTAHDQNLSGLAIRDIQLYNEKYKLFSGCKTLLKSGRVQIRT